MSTSSASAQRGLILIFGAAIVSLILDLVITITGASAWPALIVGVLAFIGGGLIWNSHRQRGAVPPLMFGAWMLCLSGLAWAIGLVAGQ